MCLRDMLCCMCLHGVLYVFRLTNTDEHSIMMQLGELKSKNLIKEMDKGGFTRLVIDETGKTGTSTSLSGRTTCLPVLVLIIPCILYGCNVMIHSLSPRGHHCAHMNRGSITLQYRWEESRNYNSSLRFSRYVTISIFPLWYDTLLVFKIILPAFQGPNYDKFSTVSFQW